MKAFIFDMDGVIINSEPLHFAVEAELAKEKGITLKEGELESYVGTRADEMWSSLKAEHQADFDVDTLLQEANEKKLAYLRDANMEPIDGIRELLEQLKEKGYKIGLGSSSTVAFIDAVLTGFSIKDQFDVVLSGEQVAKGKPAPDIYLTVANRLGVSPQHCTVLEDAAHGVQAGKAAGMTVIGYVNPHSGNQDLSKADLRVEDIAVITI
ncbi:HAD family phosphatase [Shouchella miscanthi]|uniref:HAD family phosphatase n=1 Tax=Shouchella miscanthi TaxID=2598861 RepID=A0ABU6NF63_9BACI|nr:HAD family phosphatase [Shouchella miscanthi]